MPLPVIADVFRCVFHWVGTESDEDVVSVQHFRTADDPSDLAGFLNSDVQAHQFEGLDDATEATTVDITPLDGTSAASSHPLGAWAGESGSGDSLAGFNILVEGSTGLRGPANRGRLFLPSPIESVVTNGLLDAANAAEIQAAWRDFQVALNADGVEWGVASYVNATFNAYTSIQVPRKLGIIRRRRNVG